MSARSPGADGKPKVINQVYLGSPERILEMVQGGKSVPKKIQAQSFGALWLANLVENERLILPA